MVVWPFPPLALSGVHDGAATYGLARTSHVVAFQLLLLLAGSSAHVSRSVGPVVTVSQVTNAVCTQLPTGPGTQFSPRASHDLSCDVLLHTWLVVSWICDVL